MTMSKMIGVIPNNKKEGDLEVIWTISECHRYANHPLAEGNLIIRHSLLDSGKRDN